ELRERIQALRALRESVGLRCLQLHGDEPPELVEALLPHAYKAVRIADARDVDQALRYPGEYLLVDAKVDGALGGTGVRAPIDLAATIARHRRLTLAGGLRPDNVAEAIAAVKPFCVDVASGVEVAGEPRRKSIVLVEAFVSAAKGIRF
ncbi:MAG: N-(5'-phosphoribosyl)anthranilate isomerase, partial [Polyangiales bacterium]